MAEEVRVYPFRFDLELTPGQAGSLALYFSAMRQNALDNPASSTLSVDAFAGVTSDPNQTKTDLLQALSMLSRRMTDVLAGGVEIKSK